MAASTRGRLRARTVRTRTAHWATSVQEQHVSEARSDRNQFASVNHGRPSVVATARPGEFKGPGVVQTKASAADRIGSSHTETRSAATPRSESSARTETKPRTEPKTETTPRTESKPATTHEPTTEAEPGPSRSPRQHVNRKPKPSRKTESKPAATHEPKTEAKPKAEPKPAVTHEAKPEAKPKTESEAGRDA